ncbi:phage tail fiber protein [Zavarzinia aquatilis]|uniref:Tip attachment protein J domain-containing protein n=1 Tax=Zavarzinia aquatilis TaxID=2211142 RepID=A0A317EDJ0_9PROT|nr:phage tail fiber protein [Zavarzinia aquatilis]PWR24989.1 hypothetical protein DKG74_04260 [Zavarzinia aquatilis]
MTIAATSPRIDYTGDGASTVFAVPFPFLAAEYLVVSRVLANAEHVLVLGPDYAVTGAGAPLGGTVVFAVPPAHAVRIVIRRRTAPIQLTEWQEGQKFPAVATEDALDRLTMIAQDHALLIGRAMALDAGDRWDAAGHRIINLGPGEADTDAATLGQVRDLIAEAQLPAGGGGEEPSTGPVPDIIATVLAAEQIDLSAPPTLVDDYDLEVGDIVLLPNQSPSKDRGPWMVDALDAPWVRPPEFLSGGTFAAGFLVAIQNGESYAGDFWEIKSPADGIIDANGQTWGVYTGTYGLFPAGSFLAGLQKPSGKPSIPVPRRLSTTDLPKIDSPWADILHPRTIAQHLAEAVYVEDYWVPTDPWNGGRMLERALANANVVIITVPLPIIEDLDLGTLRGKTIISRVGLGLPTLYAAAPGVTILSFAAQNCVMAGEWFLRGWPCDDVAADPPIGTGLLVKGGTDTLLITYLRAEYLDIGVRGTPASGRVYGVHIGLEQLDYITTYGNLLLGENQSNVVTYWTRERLYAVSSPTDLNPIWDAVGPNVGSGGSPGLVSKWARTYRGAKSVWTFSTGLDTGFADIQAPRKCYWHDHSARAQTSHGFHLSAGEDITIDHGTADGPQNDVGYLIDVNFFGNFRLINPIAKDCKKWGIAVLAQAPLPSYIKHPQVNGNSLESLGSYSGIYVAPGVRSLIIDGGWSGFSASARNNSGWFSFTANPAAGETITLNGRVITFVASLSMDMQVQIGATLDDTVTALAAFCNASADAEIAKLIYIQRRAHARLTLISDPGGTVYSDMWLACSGTGVSVSSPIALSVECHIKFEVNPSAGDWISIGGVRVTFVSGTPGDLEVQIGATVDDTMTAAAAALNASANATIAKMTWGTRAWQARLALAGDYPGNAHDAFTLAETGAAITRSSTTLSGGGGQVTQKYGIEGIVHGVNGCEIRNVVTVGNQAGGIG